MKKIFVFVFIVFYSNFGYADNIAYLDVQYIIDNSLSKDFDSSNIKLVNKINQKKSLELLRNFGFFCLEYNFMTKDETNGIVNFSFNDQYANIIGFLAMLFIMSLIWGAQ